MARPGRAAAAPGGRTRGGRHEPRRHREHPRGRRVRDRRGGDSRGERPRGPAGPGGAPRGLRALQLRRRRPRGHPGHDLRPRLADQGRRDHHPGDDARRAGSARHLPAGGRLPAGVLERAPSAEERERRAGVTVADLLAHCSGLPAWIQFYLEFDPEARGLPLEEARRLVLDRILESPSDYEPRTDSVYSDNGILLLGEIPGAGRRQAPRCPVRGAHRRAARDGGTPATGPRSGCCRGSRPTEDNPWRGRVVRGQVHDENTVVLGEVAAHAGLFSTAGDLGVFLQMLLNGGAMNGERLLRAGTIARFTRRAGFVPAAAAPLGWDTPPRGAPPAAPSSAGDHFSGSSFGHTGFTGPRSGWTPRGSSSASCSRTGSTPPAKTTASSGCGPPSTTP